MLDSATSSRISFAACRMEAVGWIAIDLTFGGPNTEACILYRVTPVGSFASLAKKLSEALSTGRREDVELPSEHQSGVPLCTSDCSSSCDVFCPMSFLGDLPSYVQCGLQQTGHRAERPG